MSTPTTITTGDKTVDIQAACEAALYGLNHVSRMVRDGDDPQAIDVHIDTLKVIVRRIMRATK